MEQFCDERRHERLLGQRFLTLIPERLNSEIATLAIDRDNHRCDRAQQTLNELVVQCWRLGTYFDDMSYRVLTVATTGKHFEATVEIGLTVISTTLVRVFPQLVTDIDPIELGQRLIGQRLRVAGSVTACMG
jgi:hypothetical protein